MVGGNRNFTQNPHHKGLRVIDCLLTSFIIGKFFLHDRSGIAST